MTDIAKRSIGYLVAGAIAAVLLFWTFGKVDAWFSERDEQITTATRAALTVHKATLRWADSLVTIELARAGDARRFRASLDAAYLAHAADTVPADNRLAIFWRAMADTGRMATAACFDALGTCQLVRDSLARADSLLAKAATAQLTVRNHPWGLSGGVGACAGPDGASYGLSLTIGRQLLPFRWPWAH